MTKLIKNQIKNIGEVYLSVLALPSIYRYKNKIVLLLIIFIILLSICFNTGLYLYFGSRLTNLFIVGSVFYVIFLKFNFILRLFNTLLYLPINLYKNYNFNKYNKDNIKYVPTSEVICSYYLFNFICSIIAIQVIFKIEQNLLNYNILLADFIYLYSIIACPILALLYIDYITGEDFKINKIKIGKLGTTVHFILLVLLIYTTIVLITNFIDPIRCSSNCDNQQVNQNTQNTNKASNLQTNSNNQGSPNSSNTSLVKINKENKLVLINKQANINSQIIETKTINSNPILSHNPSSESLSLIEYKKVNELNIPLKSNVIKLNQSINQQLIPNSENLTTSKEVTNSNLDLVTKNIITNKPIISQDILSKSILNTNLYTEIRRKDFFDILVNIASASTNQFDYEINLKRLINLALEQDYQVNFFLVNAKANLLEYDLSVLNNKLIHLNHVYSIKIAIDGTNQILNINGASIFDLYKNIKLELAKSSENKELYKAYDILKNCLEIYDPNNKYNFLLNVELNDSFMRHTLVDNLAHTTHNIILNNKFIFWPTIKAFSFCYVDQFNLNQPRDIEIILGDSKLTLFNYINKVHSDELFYGHVSYTPKGFKMLEAINQDIPNYIEDNISDFNINDYININKEFSLNKINIKINTSKWSTNTSNNNSNIAIEQNI